MIFGVLKIVNLAHGSFFLFGAHVALSIYDAGGGLTLAVAGGAAVGARSAGSASAFFSTNCRATISARSWLPWACCSFLATLRQIIWGGTPRMLTPPGWLGPRCRSARSTYPVYRLALIVVGVAVALGLWWLVDTTTFGARARAAVDDEETALAVGISVPATASGRLHPGRACSPGLSGALGAGFIGASPGIDIEVFLLALVIVVIGGVGSLGGAFLAAILVGITDSVSKMLWPEASYFVLFAPMAAFLILRPTGLFGRPITVRPPARSDRGKLLRAPAVARIGKGVVGLCRRLPQPGWVALGLAAIVALPLVAAPYDVSIATLCFIWAIFAVGLNAVLGYAGMPSLGHAAFFGTGAYAVALISRHLQVDGWVMLVLAVAVSAAMAMLIGLMVLRTKEVQLLLATVAAGQVLWGMAIKWRSLTGGDDGMANRQKIFVPGIDSLSATNRVYVVVATVFVIVVHHCGAS